MRRLNKFGKVCGRQAWLIENPSPACIPAVSVRLPIKMRRDIPRSNGRVMKIQLLYVALIASPLAFTGCSSSRADQGALFGGLTGAGVGALVGNAVGHTGAGAAIGAGVGAISGAAVGSSLDDIEAKNKAEIEARLGRPVAAGSVTTGEVIAMTRSGVSDGVIANHIRNNGVAAPLSTDDIILLQENGVSPIVVRAMQNAPLPVQVQTVRAPTQTIIVRERYPGPYFYIGHGHHHHCW
jgi:hypothetical protein